MDDPQTRVELIERGDAGIVINAPLTSLVDLQGNPDITVDHQTNLMVQYLAMTVAGPLSTPAARRAPQLGVSLRRSAFRCAAGFCRTRKGTGQRNVPRLLAHRHHLLSTDLTEARRLLDEAGVEQGTTLSLANANGNAENQAIAELFQANLQEIGLDLDIQNLDIGAYVEMAFQGISRRANGFRFFRRAGIPTTTMRITTSGHRFPAAPGSLAMPGSIATIGSRSS